jgi:hypothetical protein
MASWPALASVAYEHGIVEEIRFKTLFANYDDLGKETRKQKWLYPKRDFKLRYVGITEAQVKTLYDFYIARSGAHAAFNFFHHISRTYTGEYVGTGDGSTTIFNLPSKQASSYTLYVDGVAQTGGGTDYTFASEGGADGADKATFTAAPTSGERITFTFTGYLKGRVRFEEDALSFESFFERIAHLGLGFKGLLNE